MCGLDKKQWCDYWITHAGIAYPLAWVGRSMASVWQCLSVCPRSNKKTAWAINTKLTQGRIKSKLGLNAVSMPGGAEPDQMNPTNLGTVCL